MQKIFLPSLLAFAALLLPAVSLSAATPILSVDFGTTQTSKIENGFSAFEVTNVGVAGPVTKTFGDYTVRITNGITVDGSGFLNASGTVNARDRFPTTPLADTGTFTYNHVYTDFVTQGIDTGVQITGLAASTSYEVRFYTYDHSNSRTQTFKNLTGGANTTLGTFGWTAGTTFGSSTADDIYSVGYTVVSDASGRLTFDINNAGGTTLLNALVITDLSTVPEPSSFALLLGTVALGVAFRRRRRV
jgi:hypothetical protein